MTTTVRALPSSPSLGEVFTSPSLPDGVALSFTDVAVRFGGVAALERITFNVNAHDVMAVVGPNGAGKSTLLNAVSGLARDNTTGSILLSGDQLSGKSPVVIARAGVGRSFQDPPLIEKETVLENVLLGDHIRLGYKMADQIWRQRTVAAAEEAARYRAEAVLTFTGLADIIAAKVGDLPYGTKKLIDISRAIVSGPSLLLLDEPTSGLDQDEQATVGRLLTELHRVTPVTILVVEHHMDVVRAVANKVVGLQAGTILAIGTPQEVLDSDEFRSAIVGDQATDPGSTAEFDVDQLQEGNAS